MIRHRAQLGELCTLVKGISPISKTPAGPYPLVTTGEEHKTADTFQFDAEAVCIPLISSTGHGHASLKRVHYQTGKFALGNLLAAALVKDREVISAKFLARYLMFTKDRLIVPLMTGAANMSISLDRLATVPVEFPSRSEQDRVVKLLDEGEQLQKLRAQADDRGAELIPALFNELFGGERNWPAHPLMKLATIVTGNTPSRNEPELFGDFIEWIKTDNIDAIHGIVTKAAEGLSQKGALRGRIVPAGCVLVTCIAGSRERIGDAAIANRDVAINQQINAVIPGAEVDSVFLCEQIGALKAVIQRRATGNMTGIINKSVLGKIPISCPPVPAQKQFAERVLEIRQLEAEQARSRRRLNDLFESMQHDAFNGKLGHG